MVKSLTTTNRVRYVKINPQSSLHYSFYVLKKSLLSKIAKDRNPSSQIFEMRIIFIASIRKITYGHYRKQPMTKCEIKLKEISSGNINLMKCLLRNTAHPLIKKYSHIP